MESNGGVDESSLLLRELQSLKTSKRDIEARISVIEAQLQQIQSNQKPSSDCSNGSSDFGHELTPDMIYRYSRQLLLPSFGVQGQSNLLKSSILVIGAGGLGSPALLYLAACGVGRLGMVDHDVVELNNLHRQIIHGEAYIGRSKVESAAAACRSINSTVEVVEHREALRTSNALEIVSKYDIVVDATDNAPSRYLINDCCVLLGKPLVSGAALGLEGQLAVYNYNGGPCYRCLFPTPPPTSACQRCSDSGVLGVVPGVIGCLQALEAIKLASLVGESLSGRMLLFDALSARIRIVKIRGRSSQCEACGENATLTRQQFQQFDYENFTHSPLSAAPLMLKLLTPDSRISSKEYNNVIKNGSPHVLVDVRPSHHYKIVSLPKSLNIPLASLESRLPELSSELKSVQESNETPNDSDVGIYVVCRRGNDSQRAVQLLHRMGFTSAKDIVGGLESWAHDVDHRTCIIITNQKMKMNIGITKSSIIPPSETIADSHLTDLLISFDPNVMKKALADLLVSFYLMAGRLDRAESGRIVINCNGEGVLFVEAELDSSLDDLGEFTPSPKLHRLTPTVDCSGNISSYPLCFAR
ncbi:hypothetical protein SSX86_008693 [Deinandra increscens subsp. villosa]|uniref:Adenylyltransferase and sulfurtransferase MOCS3 n=1 Tax=Deinandra increscens subsp. villosa TaxID=3103831 RepID=A0AAP0DFQ2_9ASTR